MCLKNGSTRKLKLPSVPQGVNYRAGIWTQAVWFQSSWLLLVELSAPANSYVAVLAPSSSECGLIWKKGHQRCKELSEDEVVLELGEPLTQQDWCPHKGAFGYKVRHTGKVVWRDREETVRRSFAHCSQKAPTPLTLGLDFWPPELWVNGFLSLSHFVCGTLLWQP